MSKNLQYSYTKYFLKGVRSNLLNVGTSWLVGFATNIVLFNTLSNSDYIFYSVSHLTVFFFVSFSNLEFGKLIRKYFPNIDNKICDKIIFKLIFNSAVVLVLSISLFISLSQYLNLYSNFDLSLSVFYGYIFICSFLQIISNFFGEYLGANQKFHIQEIKYLKYSTPLRVIGLLVFYFYIQNIFFILALGLSVRLVNLAITFTVSEASYLNFKTIKLDSETKQKFSTKKNLSFTYKNFIFFNYPLLLLSYLPIYLSNFHTANDIAVLSLAITLFNSIKPILNGVLVVINPSIQQLKHLNQDIKLFKIIRTVFTLLHSFTVFGLISMWSLLNFTSFTEGLFSTFSFNLFSDLALTSVLLSLIYILSMITHSYFLSIDYENKIFQSSIGALLASVLCLTQYDFLGRRINLSLIIILAFYLVYFISSYFVTSEIYGNRILYTLGVTFLFTICLRTYFYESYIIFLTINSLNLAILLYSLKKILKQNAITLRNLLSSQN
jgi:hypothetical protein